MAYKEVLSIAGGRIWSGEKALQLGLVDKIGDLKDAIDSAAQFADINDYKIVSYEKEMDPFEMFLNELLNDLNSRIEINNNLQALNQFLDARYEFINPDEKINKAVYCFECEFFNSQ